MSRAWSISAGGLSPGIALADGRVTLGESGRGRKLVEFPPPAGSELSADGAVILAVPGRPGEVAVVLLRDHSGFRGGWSLRPARTESEYSAVLGLRAEHAAAEQAGEAARAACPSGRYGDEANALARAAMGAHTMIGMLPCAVCNSRVPPRPALAGVREIARGECAQGIAGRMGGGPEVLLALAPGARVEIARSGRLYGKPETLVVEADAVGAVTVSDPYAAAETAAAEAAW